MALPECRQDFFNQYTSVVSKSKKGKAIFITDGGGP
jgi:hypothetical protein